MPGERHQCIGPLAATRGAIARQLPAKTPPRTIGTLRATRQGDFRLDPNRSAVDPANVKAFPRNSEIEATLTFASDNPGGYVRDVAPNPNAVTVRERQSFVQLPDPGYVPRRNDPRAAISRRRSGRTNGSRCPTGERALRAS